MASLGILKSMSPRYRTKYIASLSAEVMLRIIELAELGVLKSLQDAGEYQLLIKELTEESKQHADPHTD